MNDVSLIQVPLYFLDRAARSNLPPCFADSIASDCLCNVVPRLIYKIYAQSLILLLKLALLLRNRRSIRLTAALQVLPTSGDGQRASFRRAFSFFSSSFFSSFFFLR